MDGRLTLGAAALAFLAWLAILLAAWPTWHGMNHATGAVAACADAVLHGEAPGTSRGDAVLSTLYFPPVPLFVAGLKGAGLSWRAALRWVDLAGVLSLLAAVALAVRSLGGGGIGVTVALALLFVSFPFVSASLAARADPWAAALSLGALAAWCRDPRRSGWGAPALAALAWLVKATALAMPLAALIAAVGSGTRRAAGPFAARFFAAVALGMVVTIPWHGPGWYGDALHTLFFSPPNTGFFLRGPFELARYLASYTELTVAAALALVYLTGEWSRGQPVRPFAVASLLLAMAVMSNRAADHNHLLEPVAVAAVGAGMWAERASRRETALGAALILIAVTGAAWRETLIAWNAARSPETRGAIVARVAAVPGPVLCEDPLIALAAGRRADVVDATVLRAGLMRGDARDRALVERIAAGRYAGIVLDQDLAAERNHWYRDFQFGESAIATIADHYRLAGTLDGYRLYVPANRDTSRGRS